MLKIISFNIAMLPSLIGIGDNTKRYKEIFKRLDSIEWDVVCFQESFDNDFIEKYGGENNMNVFTDNKKRHKIGVSSGLTIMSKFPIVDRELIRYKDYAGDENFARKGAMYVRIKKLDRNYDVITTHLQAGGINKSVFHLMDVFKKNKKSADEIKALQLKQLGQLIIKRYTHSIPLVLVGDFNFQFYSVFSVLRKELNFGYNIVDTFDVKKSEYKNSNRQGDSRIDLSIKITKTNDTEVNVYSVIINPFEELSDHKPTYTVIDV